MLFVLCAGTRTTAAVDEAEPSPSPTPVSDRAPTYVRPVPAGALQVQTEPPGVGAPVLEDVLTGPGALPASVFCPTDRNQREFVGEGVIIKVTGPCISESTSSAMGSGEVAGLDIPDGEVRVDFKLVSGAERARVAVPVRLSVVDNCYAGYMPAITGQGAAGIIKLDGCGQSLTLASRGDLADRVRDDDWNSLTVRLEGANMWLFLNDELIVSVVDGGFDHGGLTLHLTRLGDVNDTAETAVVFRNLRVSQLAPR
jgi:hypothetical protein